MTIHDPLPELDEILLGDEPDFDTPPDELPPLDRAQADRLVRRIARLDAEHEREAAAVRAQVEQLEAWLRGRYETYSAQRSWLTARLRRFHEALLAADERLKTVNLPGGELRMRAQPVRWTFDTEAFIPWAQEHAPDLLRVPPPPPAAVDVAAAKRALTPVVDDARAVTADGELVPGVTVTETPPKFSIHVPDEADDTQERS